MDAAKPSTTTASQAAPVRTWPHAVRTSLFVAVISCVVGLLTRSLLQGSVQRPIAQPGEPLLTRLELNHAARAELQLLPGVGEKTAQRIDAYRILYGPFACIDDLRKVPGIGPLTIERLRPWLYIAPSRNAPAASESPPEAHVNLEALRAGKKADSLAEPIDVNTASAAELMKLPGIGPKLSQRIVDTRALAPFKNIEELRRVPGIGPKTMAKLRPYVSAGRISSGSDE